MKAASEFYLVKSSSDGLASSCKACSSRKTNEQRKHYVPEPLVESKVRSTARGNPISALRTDR